MLLCELFRNIVRSALTTAVDIGFLLLMNEIREVENQTRLHEILVGETALMFVSSLFVAISLASTALGEVILPSYGPITGLDVSRDLTLNQPLKQDVTAYLGIPFAKPPVGELRFRPPQSYEGSWTEPRAFTASQKDCMAGSKGSEDCLYLNVYVPASASLSSPLPVMFWIYGGGFSFGRVAMYNGTALAAQEDVIVVVASYRFGPLGFLANQATLTESGTTGNWGILDQRMALQWVNDNIAHFGGDQSRITIFGESAGAISVATHMGSPGSQGLFSAAIVQSAVLDLDLFYLETEDSFRFYDWMASNITHCASGEDMDCLRRIPASRFAIPESIRDDPKKAPTWAASLFPFFSFGLTVDHNVVHGSPVEMALQNRTANVPLVIGLNQDEGSVFALASPSIVRPKPSVPPTEADVRSILEYFVGDPEFVAERMEAEFHHHRARYPPVDSMDGMEQWNSDKESKWAAYRDQCIDESQYVDVHLQVQQQRQRDMQSPVYGRAAVDRMIRNFANEFLVRDLANENFEDIVRGAPQIAQLYDQQRGEEGRPSLPMYDKAPMSYLTSAARDIIFSCPALEFAAAHRDNGNKVFFYNLAFDVWNGTIFYNVDMSGAGVKAGGEVAIADLGVFHGADIPLVFKLFKSKPTVPADVNLFGLFNLFTGSQVSTPGDKTHQVADKIGCYWSNLAKCGDVKCPNTTCFGHALPDWPALAENQHSFMNIEPNGDFVLREHQQTGFAGVGAFLPSDEQCAAWDRAEFKYFDIHFHNHRMRQHHVV